MSILLIGDFILDVYDYVSIDRVSPEAPCLVGKTSGVVEKRLGGMGNVAANLKNLTDDFLAVGACDGEYKKLLELKKIPNKIVLSQGQSEKTRFVDIKSRIQVFRRDQEEKNHTISKLEEIDKILKKADPKEYKIRGIVDYRKGMFLDKTLLKHNGFEINLISTKNPNISDLINKEGENKDTKNILVLNRGEYNKVQHCWLKLYKYVVMTDGENGIHILKIKKTGEVSPLASIPGHKVSVFDVTGAGDTVFAVIAYILNEIDFSEKSLIEACKIANFAASRVVTQAGTTAIQKWEIATFRKDLLGF